MKEQLHKRRGILYYLTYIFLYTVLFLVVFSGIFIMFHHAGKSFVWKVDGLPSYIPNMYYFIDSTREMVQSFLAGDFNVQLFDFNVGLGDVVSLHMEPLYWLSLLFQPAQVEEAFNFLMILRFYVAGLSMSLFLFYFKQGRLPSLVASFAYICCGYGLFAGFRHAQFVVPMIFLPLCIIAMEEIIRKKRWYLCTLVIWFHLWCGYYFTYMNTIAMGCYFLIRFFCKKEGRTFKEFWKYVGVIAGSYLLGVMLGNITLISSFASYLTSSRTGAVDYETKINYWTYGRQWFKNFLKDFFCAGRGPGYWLRLGFIPLVYAGVVLLLIKKGRKELKASICLGTVFCMIPAVGFVFSGFGNINNRWCYIYAFALTVTLGFTLKEMFDLTKKELCLIGAAMLPFCLGFVYLFISYGNDRIYSAVAGISLVLTFGGLVFAGRKQIPVIWRSLALVFVMVVTLWGSQYLEFSPRAGGLVEEFEEAGEVYDTVTNTPLAAAGEIEDDEFYRVSTKDTPSAVQGASQILEYNGNVHYDNTAKKSIHAFYRTMGITTWSLVRMWGMDNRAFLDTLSSVKYFLQKEDDTANVPYGYTKKAEKEKDGEVYEIYENKMALPLGYTYDSFISEEKLMEYDALERQEVLLQAAAVSDEEEISLPVEKDMKLEGQKLEITDIKCKNAEITDNTITTTGTKEDPARIRLSFQAPDNCEIYLYFKNLYWGTDGNRTIKYSCGDYKSSYSLHGVRNIYETRQNDHIMNLGYHKDGANSCTITFKHSFKEISFDEIGIYCQPMENLDDYTEERREDVLEDVQILSNEVRGKISLDEEKLLVLTVPYMSGWEAYVDGEQVPILKANVMYMGLMLTSGEHTVELKYHMPGLTISLLVFAAGAIIFVVTLFLRHKKKKAL